MAPSLFCASGYSNAAESRYWPGATIKVGRRIKEPRGSDDAPRVISVKSGNYREPPSAERPGFALGSLEFDCRCSRSSECLAISCH